jgi:hypothetical protein
MEGKMIKAKKRTQGVKKAPKYYGRTFAEKISSSFLSYNGNMWSSSGKELNLPRPGLAESRPIRQTGGQKRTAGRPVLPGGNRSNKTNRVSSFEDWYKAVFGMDPTANIIGR